MKVNEIKETKEVVVRTEYIAEDGTKFRSQEECEKYEASALATVSRKLKKIGRCSQSEILYGSCDEYVEIYDIQTQEDLDNLEKYLRLKLSQRGYTEEDISSYNCFCSIDGTRKNYVFENVTYGHEVMIFWNYDEDWFWVYKDGSIEGMKRYFQEKIEKIINPEEKENENGN